MSYTIYEHKGFRKSFVKSGCRLSEEDLRNAYKEIVKNPRSSDQKNKIKKLKNYFPPFRYRIGDCRILYDIDDEKKSVIIITISQRKDAYK